MTSLLDLATTLVEIPSPSRDEAAVADFIEELLGGHEHLEVLRVGENVIARTILGRSSRVIVAGHLDTVSTGAPPACVRDGELWGLGAADMKGTIAVMLSAALELSDPSVDVTWIFYAREEIARSESGLLEIERYDPEILVGDIAILGEPTGDVIEAGCQGTLRVEITVGGVAAHSARPFMGRNAIHRAARIIDAIAEAPVRVVEIDGIHFAEQVQVVGITGGGAGNVVPSEATLLVNHRFAPDRTTEEAGAWLLSVVEDALDPTLGDGLRIVDGAPGALPHLDHPILTQLVELVGGQVTAKVGWTDVATFAERGVPAVNFGAGDPLLAHHLDERVSGASLEAVSAALRSLLVDPRWR